MTIYFSSTVALASILFLDRGYDYWGRGVRFKRRQSDGAFVSVFHIGRLARAVPEPQCWVVIAASQ